MNEKKGRKGRTEVGMDGGRNGGRDGGREGGRKEGRKEGRKHTPKYSGIMGHCYSLDLECPKSPMC
jgi:hypothetical protein